MTEAQFQSQVLALIRAMGLAAYHTHDSRRSEPGFPDLVIVGMNGVLYRELKTAKGRVSPDQKYWIYALNAAGEDAGIWRPSDWPTRIQSELTALGRCLVQRPLPSQAALRRHLQTRPRAGARKGPDLT